jgi:hypothetical protein
MAPIPIAIFCRRGAAAPLDVEDALAANVVEAEALVVLVLVPVLVEAEALVVLVLVPVLVDVFDSVFEFVTTLVVMLEDVSVLVIVDDPPDIGVTTTGCLEEVSVVVVVVSDVAVVVSVEAGASPAAVAVVGLVVWLGTNVLVTSLPDTLANVRLKSGVRVPPSTHSYR